GRRFNLHSCQCRKVA
ncbi:MAG: hypothetical protein CAF44_014660, partial [Nitrospira sp. CG24D]